MSRISTSLAIAFTIHILIGLAFLINKRPSPSIVNTKNSINVQFGSSLGGSHTKVTARRTKTLKAASTSTPLFNSNAATTQTNQTNSGVSEGNNNLGSPDGGATYNFDNLAMSYKEPIYPRLAIKRELQGSVKIRVTISTEGKPINTEILESSGHNILDNAALEAVAYWQFQPKNIQYFVEKTIVFKLKN